MSHASKARATVSHLHMTLPFFLGVVGACAVGFMLTTPASAAGAILMGITMCLTLTLDGKYNPIVDTFHVFTLLGLACLFVPPLVVLILHYYISILVLSRTFSLRAFCAGVIGLCLSGLAAMGVCHFMGRGELIAWWWEGLTSLRLTAGERDYLSLGPWIGIPWAVLVLLTLWCGVGYYVRGRMRDKIRVRTLYALLFWQAILLTLVVVILPCEATTLLAPMVMAAAPVAVHRLSLRGTRG